MLICLIFLEIILLNSRSPLPPHPDSQHRLRGGVVRMKKNSNTLFVVAAMFDLDAQERSFN